MMMAMRIWCDDDDYDDDDDAYVLQNKLPHILYTPCEMLMMMIIIILRKNAEKKKEKKAPIAEVKIIAAIITSLEGDVRSIMKGSSGNRVRTE